MQMDANCVKRMSCPEWRLDILCLVEARAGLPPLLGLFFCRFLEKHTLARGDSGWLGLTRGRASSRFALDEQDARGS